MLQLVCNSILNQHAQTGKNLLDLERMDPDCQDFVKNNAKKVVRMALKKNLPIWYHFLHEDTAPELAGPLERMAGTISGDSLRGKDMHH